MENKIDLLENIKSEISWCSESTNSDAEAYGNGYEMDALSFLNHESGFMNDSGTSNDMSLEDAAGYEHVQEILMNCAPPLMEYFARFKSKLTINWKWISYQNHLSSAGMFICNGSLPFLKEEHLKEVFPTEVGYRAIFSAALTKWKSKSKRPLAAKKSPSSSSCSQPPATSHMENPYSFIQIPTAAVQLPPSMPMMLKPLRSSFEDFVKYDPREIDIRQILSEDFQGRAALQHYEEYGIFSPIFRQTVIRCIIQWIINRKIWIERREFPDIVNKILAVFPNEDMVGFLVICEDGFLYQFVFQNDYYIPPNEANSNPQGKLYNRYYNQLNYRRKHGELGKNKKRAQNFPSPNSKRVIGNILDGVYNGHGHN